MTLLLYASAFLALLIPGQNSIQINVDSKSGDTISGEHTFRVTVDSQSAVNQVEFYVGSDLRDTETSTPYLFTYDTIPEADGDVKVRFKAYTVDSQTAERTLTLHIDNKKSAGAAFHVGAANDALSGSDWHHAIDEGRIALNIDDKSNPARIALARAYLGLQTYDKAQQYADAAITQDPNDDAALRMMASIDLRRAFNTYAKESMDRSDVLSNISDAFQGAVKARRKSLDVEVDQITDRTGDALFRYVDALLLAERYSAAEAALKPVYDKDQKNPKIVDRLAYAQLRSGRYTQAITTLEYTKSVGSLDAYADAVLALAYIQVNRNDDADKLMAAAVEDDPDNVGVRTAQAFIALKRNKTSVLSTVASDLARDEGHRTTVNYFLMALADRQQQFNAARRYFETAALAEPAYPDIYIEQANYSIRLSQVKGIPEADRDMEYKEANMYYQIALLARPESPDALTGIAVVDLLQKDLQGALTYATAARDAAPEIALGHYVLASVDQRLGNYGEAQAEMQKAIQLDKPNLEGVELPKALDVWSYMNAGGRIPVIALPGV